ncbi:hypothetical protein PMG11_04723 [Penicillium brasilianum]|uniref:Major facilitator superfamily (MFS) profile domain-containing protein n=1 Tax=Penicillium brasilianum TaxID=104259 RepID=A0A0F7VIF1_PENBI|nr:hypothetical protein PMG11_04723 [Penicillium brasilianum]
MKPSAETKLQLARAMDVKEEFGHDEYASGPVILTATNGEVQRIPHPSDSPNDPLNWPVWRKRGLIFVCCWFSLFSLVLVGGTGPFLETLIVQYAATKSVAEVVGLSTYPSLVMALGNLLILPAALALGRRPVFLFCTVLLLGSTIGAAVSSTFEAHLACRILEGIATGATESLLPLMITEITFLHEREFWFGIYWGSQSTFNAVFLISNSYLVAATSWRWFYGLFGIMAGIGLIFAFFAAPETRFHRGIVTVGGRRVYTDHFGVTHVVEATEHGDEVPDVLAEERGVQDQPDSYAQRLKPWHGLTPDAGKVFLDTYVQIAKALLSPGVVFAILLSSIVLGIGIALSLTYSTVLIQEFHWSPGSIGLMNIGVIPAAIAAILYAGWGGEKFAIWMAKRKDGVHFAEQQLVPLIVPTIVGVAGLILYGFTAESPQSSSSWGIIMGWTLYNFAFISTIIVTTSYASEVMPSNPGAALILVVGAKNVVSFGAAYGLTPMVTRFGYRDAYLILMGIYLAIAVLGVPVYLWKARKSAQWSRSN